MMNNDWINSESFDILDYIWTSCGRHIMFMDWSLELILVLKSQNWSWIWANALLESRRLESLMEPIALDLFEFDFDREISVGVWRRLNINYSSGWMLDNLWTYLALNMEVGLCYGVGASMRKSREMNKIWELGFWIRCALIKLYLSITQLLDSKLCSSISEYIYISLEIVIKDCVDLVRTNFKQISCDWCVWLVYACTSGRVMIWV